MANMLANITHTVLPPVTVSREWIETPLLHGPTGSVVTLLNWTTHGQDIMHSAAAKIVPPGPSHEPNGGPSLPLVVNVTLGYEPKSARSVKRGALPMTTLGHGRVQVTVTLAAADFLIFEK